MRRDRAGCWDWLADWRDWLAGLGGREGRSVRWGQAGQGRALAVSGVAAAPECRRSLSRSVTGD